MRESFGCWRKANTSPDYHYSRHAEAGKPITKMANYKNVINPRVLYLEQNLNIIIGNLVPVSELHALIEIVTGLGKLILKLWPVFKQLYKF